MKSKIHLNALLIYQIRSAQGSARQERGGKFCHSSCLRYLLASCASCLWPGSPLIAQRCLSRISLTSLKKVATPFWTCTELQSKGSHQLSINVLHFCLT